MKHKWAKEAIAFFSGETIQCFHMGSEIWFDARAESGDEPDFFDPSFKFRIKPKEELVMYKWSVFHKGEWVESEFFAEDKESFIKKTATFGRKIKRLDYTATPFEVEK